MPVWLVTLYRKLFPPKPPPRPPANFTAYWPSPAWKQAWTKDEGKRGR
jgi:hypothetical protein